DPAVAIPAIIRNAERLELLEGLHDRDKPDPAQEFVQQTLQQFARRLQQGGKYQPCPSCTPVPGAPPAPPATAASLSEATPELTPAARRPGAVSRLPNDQLIQRRGLIPARVGVSGDRFPRGRPLVLPRP